MGKNKWVGEDGKRIRKKASKHKHQEDPDLSEYLGKVRKVGEKRGRHAARRAKNRAVKKEAKLQHSERRKWMIEEVKRQNEEKKKKSEDDPVLSDNRQTCDSEGKVAKTGKKRVSFNKVGHDELTQEDSGSMEWEEEMEGEKESEAEEEESEPASEEEEATSDDEAEEDYHLDLADDEGLSKSHSKKFMEETGLADSDDDDKADMESFDEDEGFDSDTDMVEKSKQLELENKKIMMESELEMKEQVNKLTVDIPRLKAVKRQLKEAPDMQTIHARIQDTVYILNDYKARRKGSIRREEYQAILEQDLLVYYSYNPFLLKKLIDFFPLSELLEFLEANEIQRPLTIRTNTLKTRRKALAQSLISQGINLDAIPWSKVGLVIYSSGKTTLGACPEYMAGHYIIQGASSFLPVVALAPKEGERVLDLCAAPGGKATHIAAMQRNNGMLFTNDINKDRCKALIGNIHRMGILNSVVSCMDGRLFAKRHNYFDRVLVDAPCTGTGVISKDPSIKVSKTKTDIIKCSTLQKQLLLAAIDCTNPNSKTGGCIVYSTCSIFVEENEDVVYYALRHRDVKLVSTGIEVGREGLSKFKNKQYPKSMSLCRRVYPHTNNMDGFFVAKLQKISSQIKTQSTEITKDVQEQGEKLKALVNSLMDPIDKKAQKLNRRKVQKQYFKKLKKMQQAQQITEEIVQQEASVCVENEPE